MPKTTARDICIWGGLAIVILTPVLLSLTSPLLAWRRPIYIVAGFAGVLSMALLVLQPIIIQGGIPRVAPRFARVVHRYVGGTLVALVALHVIGLWITSPPDVVDALLFSSPTPFSLWGVIAMWGTMGTAVVARYRRRIGWPPRVWRRIHLALAAIIVPTGCLHAIMIQGTMEPLSKYLLCLCAMVATLTAIWRERSR